jgi:transposase-like protein
MTDRADKTVGQAARELEINAGMLARWRSKVRETPEGGVKVFPGNGNRRDKELARLRKRVAELEEVSETSFPPNY